MIRAELLRLVRSRTPWLFLLGTLVLVAVAAYQQYDSAHQSANSVLESLDESEDDQDVVRETLGIDPVDEARSARVFFESQAPLVEEYRAALRPAMGIVRALGYMATLPGLLIAIVTATWLFGSEYSANTMRLLLLRQPNRLRLILTKLVVLVGFLVVLTGVVALMLTLELWVLDRVRPIASLAASPITLDLAPPFRLFTAWITPMIAGVSLAVVAGVITRSGVGNLLTPAAVLLGDFVVGRAVPAIETWTLSYNLWRAAAPYGFLTESAVSAQVWYTSFDLANDANRSIVLLIVVAMVCIGVALVTFRRQEYT